MVILDCPNCTKDVVLGSDTTGVYQCPNCSKSLEYLSGNELTVSVNKTHTKNGSLVNSGIFKGWRAFGYRPKRTFSPNDEKLPISDKISMILFLSVQILVLIYPVYMFVIYLHICGSVFFVSIPRRQHAVVL